MLNHVTLLGKVADQGPKLTYGETGQPECRWTLAIEEPGAQGKLFTTYIPCSAWGKAAETIAEPLEPGQLVCIRDGRLTFRRTLVQGEQVSQLEVSTWSVSVLTPAAATAASYTRRVAPWPQRRACRPRNVGSPWRLCRGTSTSPSSLGARRRGLDG
jgi:single-stranded DNA-binding protein